MASIANITIKKADQSTDILWTAVSPSAGAGVPAIWKSLTVGTADQHHPEFRLTIGPSKDGKSTKARGTYMYPSLSTDTTTGITTTVRVKRGSVDFDLPREMPDTEIAEAVFQFVSLLASTLIRSSVRDRVSPT